MQNVSLLESVQAPSWDSFVESSDRGTPFHLSSWIGTIQKTYSYDALMFVGKNENGEITCVFPSFRVDGLLGGCRLVSLPFSDYGGPLWKSSVQNGDIIQRAVELCASPFRCVEIRGPVNGSPGFNEWRFYKRHVLVLCPDPDEMIKRIDKRTIQYSIRKARRDGVVIREDNSPEGMDHFINLNALTRKKHGVPMQPKAFFRNLYESMVAKGSAFILLAYHDTNVVAGGLFMPFRETVYYKYNASNPFYLSKIQPNHLLTWHAIEQACLKGYRKFDFGRTSTNNAGLIRYKEMWGAQTLDIPYNYFPDAKGASSTQESSFGFRLFTALWRNMPDKLSESLSQRIYKHFG